MALRTLPQWIPLTHSRSVVGASGDLLVTPLNDGTALFATSPPRAPHAAAGEGRLKVQVQHAREFSGLQNPTNQQISVNSQPPLVSSCLLCAAVCCQLAHTNRLHVIAQGNLLT